MKPFHNGETRFYSALVGQGRIDVLAKQPTAGGRLAAIDFANQTTGNATRDGARKLQALPRCSVDCHVTCPRDPPWRVEKHTSSLLRRVEIGKQSTDGREFGARGRSEAVERGQAE